MESPDLFILMSCGARLYATQSKRTGAESSEWDHESVPHTKLSYGSHTAFLCPLRFYEGD